MNSNLFSLSCQPLNCDVSLFSSFPDVSCHSAEGHSRSGSDVRRDGPHIYKFPEQPGSHLLGKLRLPFPQTPGFLGQRSGSQDLFYPGLDEKTLTSLFASLTLYHMCWPDRDPATHSSLFVCVCVCGQTIFMCLIVCVFSHQVKKH